MLSVLWEFKNFFCNQFWLKYVLTGESWKHNNYLFGLDFVLTIVSNSISSDNILKYSFGHSFINECLWHSKYSGVQLVWWVSLAQCTWCIGGLDVQVQKQTLKGYAGVCHTRRRTKNNSSGTSKRMNKASDARI